MVKIHLVGSRDESRNRSRLIELQTGHVDIEVAVMFDWVSMGIEEDGVTVADGFMAFCGVVGQANVATCHVEFAVVARHDDEGCFAMELAIFNSLLLKL